MMTCLAVLIELRIVTDRRTDGQTDRQTGHSNNLASIVFCRKNLIVTVKKKQLMYKTHFRRFNNFRFYSASCIND